MLNFKQVKLNYSKLSSCSQFWKCKKNKNTLKKIPIIVLGRVNTLNFLVLYHLNYKLLQSVVEWKQQLFYSASKKFRQDTAGMPCIYSTMSGDFAPKS